MTFFLVFTIFFVFFIFFIVVFGFVLFNIIRSSFTPRQNFRNGNHSANSFSDPNMPVDASSFILFNSLNSLNQPSPDPGFIDNSSVDSNGGGFDNGSSSFDMGNSGFDSGSSFDAGSGGCDCGSSGCDSSSSF